MSEILPLMIEEEKIMITQFLHQPPETPSQVFSLSKRKKKVGGKIDESLCASQSSNVSYGEGHMLNRKAPAGKKATPWGEIAHLMIAVSHRKVIRGSCTQEEQVVIEGNLLPVSLRLFNELVAFPVFEEETVSESSLYRF